MPRGLLILIALVVGAGARALQAIAGACVMAVGVGCRPAQVPSAVARGNEPFWAVEVADSGIVYRSPEHAAGVVYRNVVYQSGDSTRTWRASSNGRPITLILELMRCTDSMSGQESPWTARAEVGSVRLEGCGES